MLSQNTALWLRQKWIHSGLPKAFVSSTGVLNLPITSLPVDNFHDRALWCKSTVRNYNMHGWILCRYCATCLFWWISGLRAVTMWSSSSFTKTVTVILFLYTSTWRRYQLCILVSAEGRCFLEICFPYSKDPSILPEKCIDVDPRFFFRELLVYCSGSILIS